MTALAEPIEAPTEFYRPGPSIQEFHDSSAMVRFLIGGRGSGKTAGSGMESIGHIWHNAGAKVMFIRKTEESQADTTIDTIKQLFENCGDLYQDTGDSLFASWNNGRTFRVPSQKAVEAFNAVLPTFSSKAERQQWLASEGNRLCGFIEFRGLPHAKSKESKLRGFECSMAVIVEADQVTEEDFQMLVPCLRWKGADPKTCDANGFIRDTGIIVETNPPSPRHWIALLEEEWKKGEHPRYHFWHIHTAENEHNLPPGYVENLKHVYRNNNAMLRRMVYGEYKEAYDGNPVYYAFRDEHVYQPTAKEPELQWVTGAYLIRGWDFGTTNAVVWSAYFQKGGVEYWRVLMEQFLEGSDTDRQARGALDITQRDFPFWNDREQCSGLLDFCDPAGNSSSFTRKIKVNADGKDTMVNESAVNILRTYGIHPGFTTVARGLQETIALVNRLMEKRDGPTLTLPNGKKQETGNLVFHIDKDHCPVLYRGLCGAYRYSNAGEPGYLSNVPLKGDLALNTDHPADAFRYSAINVLRLLKAEMEATKQSLHHKKRGKNPNPDRKR